jgi:energy-coupling factor transporter ATP-binding protein EcfA2
VRLDPRYEEPFAWWGPGWQAPAPRGIADLLHDETIDSWSAANLWAALARRQSLAVVAGGSGVGKTTLLTALLDFLPPGTRRVYLRGCFETFAFLSDSTINPRETAVMINEISPHLPVYLWGPAVARILEATQRGFMLLATAHADSVHDLVQALTSSPLHIRAAQVAAFEFVVVLKSDEDKQSGRRVREVWRLEPIRDGVALASLQASSHDISDISHETSIHHTDPEAWFPKQELIHRQHILEDLRDQRIGRLPPGSLFADTGVGDSEP